MYPALEGTLETHRTTATLSILGYMGVPLTSRQIAPFGGKHLAPLLDLCIPGIDLNDPGKTVQTAMFVTQALSQITVLDDLTRPEYLACVPEKSGAGSMVIDGDGSEETRDQPGDPEAHLSDPSGFGPSGSKAEEDQLLRESTAMFPDWIVRLLRAVFNILDNLPEPGKGGKAGGKQEEHLLAALGSMLDSVCAKLAPRLFDQALRLFYEYVAHSPRANCARAISYLTSCFARADSKKTMALFVPLCCRMIKQELSFGAASVPSTSTSTAPLNEDTAFQWYCYLLNGTLAQAGESILPHSEDILSVMKDMLHHVRSERGCTHYGRILSAILAYPAAIWAKGLQDDPRVRQDDFIAHSHLHWGQTEEAADAIINWHLPSEGEIDFALSVLREITVPSVEKIDQLVSDQVQDFGDSSWAKEFSVRFSLMTSVSSEQAHAVRLLPAMELSHSQLCRLHLRSRPAT